ncbi:MAG: DNA cytosine methyltransferase [Rubrobacteraceae bacterium]
MASFYELFAGIGLVREALEPLGWKCVYANDFDESKRAIYEARFPEYGEFDGRDLWDVDASGLQRPVDLIAASFPCIDLSLAGKREGLKGRHSGTFWAFTRILERLREEEASPRGLMIENVSGFLSSNEGRDFGTAVGALKELGYTVDAVQVTAEYFTPQSRPRIFVLGVRNDLAPLAMALPNEREGESWRREVESNPALRPRKVRDLMLGRYRAAAQPSLLETEDEEPNLNWGIVDFPEPPRRAETLVDIIDWEEDSWWSKDRTYKALSEMALAHREKVEAMKGAGGRQAATAYRRRRNGASVYEVRNDGVAGCLRTARGGSSTQIVVVAENEKIKMRWMSPREYTRLQGTSFSDELDQFGDAALKTAFGDAVCVPAVRWIADHAFRNLMPET